MGDGVTGENELVIEIGSAQAGGKQGQLILEDVTVNIDRDNTKYAGIGNDTMDKIAYGNLDFSLSHEGPISEAQATVLNEHLGDTPLSGTLLGPALDVDIGKIDWNAIEISASDGDGAPTLSVDADARELDIEQVNEAPQ